MHECRDCGTVRAHMCGANVRSAEDVQTAIRSERDAECVRVRACGERAGESSGEYPISLVGIKMRYGSPVTLNDRAPAPAPRAARCAARPARQSTLPDHQTDHPYTRRLTYPCKLLRRSALLITQY